MNITRQQFLRYLKEKNVYSSWLKNTIRNMRIGPNCSFFEEKFENNINKFIDYYIEFNQPEEIIMFSFTWSQTEEGEDFWLGIHNELRDITNGYKSIEYFCK